jgi:hypothetical protein
LPNVLPEVQHTGTKMGRKKKKNVRPDKYMANLEQDLPSKGRKEALLDSYVI